MIIGVAVTVLGIALAVRNSQTMQSVDLTLVGALISVLGAVTLGTAQTGRVVAVVPLLKTETVSESLLLAQNPGTVTTQYEAGGPASP